jgi:TM2 domain-containing membrane protein YozV
MFCRNCGKEVAEQAVVCISCGCPPLKGNKFCQACGILITAAPGLQPDVCVKCGVKLAKDEAAKSKLAAGLLGIFVGGFGVHRFYLGYVGIGIVQIIVTLITCGVGALWGFIEGIVIIAGGWPKDAQGLPLKE